MTTLINGLPSRHIDSRDRGLNYGDGHFTTIKIVRGQPQLWDYHARRLQRANDRLGFHQFDAAKVLAEVRQVARGAELAVVKVLITRGIGGRGYQAPTNVNETRIVAKSSFPAHYQDWQTQGIRVDIAKEQLAVNPLSHGLKSLNRLEQVMIKTSLSKAAVDDLIVLDADGYLCCASAANIFWCKEQRWYTPALNRSGVHGVARERLLDENGDVEQGNFPVDALLNADQAFICNALMGVVPIRSIAGQSFSKLSTFPEQFDTNLTDKVVE